MGVYDDLCQLKQVFYNNFFMLIKTADDLFSLLLTKTAIDHESSENI